MQIKEINVSRPVCFNIGQQYSNAVLVIHFKGLPDLPNKYIYVKKDNYEKEVPLVGDLYVVSRPLTTYSGEVKAQIIARDPGSAPIALTPNFKMMITPSNYSGIGEDENYPDDPNIKNYYVKIDGKIQSMDELIALVQSKLDNGEFVGAQGPKGEKGDPGEKGEPGDVTEEYRNLASQIAQNASDAQASATNAQVSATNSQKILDDTKTFANQAISEVNQIKTDTNTLKDEANTSAVNAKASEDKAKEYADNLKESTDAISQNTKAINELNDKKITKFYASNQGETHLADSDNGKIQDLKIYGQSKQDGEPSPSNPVEIKNVVNPTIKVIGKNLWKIHENGYINNTNGDIADSHIESYGVTDFIKMKKNIVVQSKSFDKTSNYAFAYRVGFYDSEKKWIQNIIIQTLSNPNVVDISSFHISKAEYIRVSAPNTIFDDLQIEYGTQASNYEPYKEQSIALPITLNAIPVSSGGNVTIDGQQYIADRVVEKDGVFGIERNIREIHMNTKTMNNVDMYPGWNKVEGISDVAYYNKEPSEEIRSLIYISNITSSILGQNHVGDNNNIVYFIKDSIGYSQSELIAKAIDIDMYIMLQDAIFEPLPVDVQAKLRTLSTNYPVTNITVGSEELDGYAVFNYPISLANGWNYVKQQLNDNRDYIYDMDLQSAEAYVNSEYAVTLTELEV